MGFSLGIKLILLFWTRSILKCLSRVILCSLQKIGAAFERRGHHFTGCRFILSGQFLLGIASVIQKMPLLLELGGIYTFKIFSVFWIKEFVNLLSFAFSKLCNHISCSLLVSHLSIYFVYHSYLSSYFCFVCLLLLSFFLFPVWSPFKQLFLYCTYNLHKLPRWALAPGANVKNKHCLNEKEKLTIFLFAGSCSVVAFARVGVVGCTVREMLPIFVFYPLVIHTLCRIKRKNFQNKSHFRELYLPLKTCFMMLVFTIWVSLCSSIQASRTESRVSNYT